MTSSQSVRSEQNPTSCESTTWKGYRLAAEQLKSERRLYINGAGAYRGQSEEESYLTFVERAEQVIAEEQARYWQEPGVLEGKIDAVERGDV